MKGNGIVELNERVKERSTFFCMRLVSFIYQESHTTGIPVAELYDNRFNEAKIGMCNYRKSCTIYQRTIKEKHPMPKQLVINFNE